MRSSLCAEVSELYVYTYMFTPNPKNVNPNNTVYSICPQLCVAFASTKCTHTNAFQVVDSACGGCDHVRQRWWPHDRYTQMPTFNNTQFAVTTPDPPRTSNHVDAWPWNTTQMIQQRMFDAQLRGISCVRSFYAYFNVTQKCTEPECCLRACMRCMQSPPPPFARLPASKCIGTSIRALPRETCYNIGLANLPRIAKHMMEPAATQCTFIRPSVR